MVFGVWGSFDLLTPVNMFLKCFDIFPILVLLSHGFSTCPDSNLLTGVYIL
jgi:hypothetical protein